MKFTEEVYNFDKTDSILELYFDISERKHYGRRSEDLKLGLEQAANPVVVADTADNNICK